MLSPLTERSSWKSDNNSKRNKEKKQRTVTKNEARIYIKIDNYKEQ